MTFDTQEGGWADRWLMPGLGLAMIVGLSIFLSVFVSVRQGNLAWDDAAYLQQGLHLARLVEDHGPHALFEVFRTRPKPPLLAAWIEAVALAVGRHRITPVIVLASVGPFVLLMATVAILAHRRSGPRAAPLALLLLASSPLALSYGAKVMVETFMGLFILLAYHAAVRIRERPTRGWALALGLATGAAAMTKATVALLLVFPLLDLALALLRADIPRILKARMGFWFLVSAVAVAGPWYALNGEAAARFSMHAAQYNLLAEGKAHSTPIGQRLLIFGEELAGWPILAVLLFVLAAGLMFSRNHANFARAFKHICGFDRVALIGMGSGAFLLLFPPHFDARFLLPTWPAMAVCAAGWILSGLQSVPSPAKFLVVAALGLGLTSSGASLLREPRITTYWETGVLLDELVNRHGVRLVANIGDAPDWNVCKTGLINELRDEPSVCSVMHDLSRLSSDELEHLAARCDALIVLDRDALPPTLVIGAPGLNRAYEAIDQALTDDRFERVDLPRLASLPPLNIYVSKARESSLGAAPSPGRRRR